MAIMLKIRWDVKKGRENEFRENQKKLCAVMGSDHPGVICYHVDYPAPGVSEWVEIYANDSVFKAHLDNRKGKEPLATLIGACDKITCRCWGDPGCRVEEDPGRLRSDLPRDRGRARSCCIRKRTGRR